MNPAFGIFQRFPFPLRWALYRAVLLMLALGSIFIFVTGAWGQKVLVAGGAISTDPATYTTSAEVFDPSTGNWTLTANDIPNAPPPPAGLCSPNMVSLGNRKVLLAGGGCTDLGTTTNAASLYDPSTNQWTATGTVIPNFMNFGRDQFGMVELFGGKALAFDGCAGSCIGPNILGQFFDTVGNSAETYSYQSNTWTTVQPAITPRGNLETSNVNQPAVVLQDGRVLTCNGNINGVDEVTNTCEIYNPATNSWAATGAMAASETGLHQFVVLPNGGMVLTVLNDGLHSSLFDPNSGTWSSPQAMDSTAGAQVGGQLVLRADGGALYSGGTDDRGNPVATAQVYNPSSNRWFVTGSMTTPRNGHIAVLLNDTKGHVLVAGGEGSNGVILPSAEIYDPNTGGFTATTSMNVARLQANALLIANPVPLISQPLAPDAAAAGGSDFTLTVNGSGFVASSAVNWNGTPLATTLVNFDQLTAVVPAGDIATAGTASVTVTTPAPGGGTSNVAFFTVTNPTNTVSLASSLVNVGFSPYSVVVSDFDKNGTQDLAVVNGCGADQTCQSAGTLSILLGNGDGTFSTKSNPAVGFQPVSAAVGDFNADGKLDLAVANNCSNCDNGTVSILLGNGDGNFTPGTDFNVDLNPTQVIAADFNGDGDLDLAIVNYGSNIIRVALGKGDGTFNFVPDMVVGSNPTSLVSGDFNGDGILDLAVTNSGDGTVTILLGNGNGTFTPAPVQPVTNLVSPVFVTAGDFNHDGNLDLAIADGGSLSLTILLGDGHGNFSLASSAPASSQFSTFVNTADFNGDGNLDLAVTGSCGSLPDCVPMTTIYLGNGDGTFGTGLNYTAGNQPLGNGFADFNGDGRLDLAVANSGDNTVSILLQSPAVTLAPVNLDFGTQPINTTSSPLGVLLSNTGSAPLNVSGISLAGLNGSEFAQTNDCGAVVLPGTNCSIQVTFTPVAPGPRTDMLFISDNAPGSPQNVPLSGVGTSPQGPTCTLQVQSTSSALTISAVASCSDSSGTIISTTIDWGDGSQPASGSSGMLTGMHTYNAAGTYTVTVTATDNLMQVGGFSEPVTLAPPPPPAPAGQQTTVNLTVPAGTNPSSFSFSCTAIGPDGSPIPDLSSVGIDCTFAPSGTNQVAVTITTTGKTLAVLHSPRLSIFSTSLAFWMPFPAIVLMGSGMLGSRSRRKSLRRYLTLGLLMGLLLTVCSCGGGFTANPPQVLNSTPVGTYFITVSGKAQDRNSPTGFTQVSLIVPLTVTGS